MIDSDPPQKDLWKESYEFNLESELTFIRRALYNYEIMSEVEKIKEYKG